MLRPSVLDHFASIFGVLEPSGGQAAGSSGPRPDGRSRHVGPVRAVGRSRRDRPSSVIHKRVVTAGTR